MKSLTLYSLLFLLCFLSFPLLAKNHFRVSTSDCDGISLSINVSPSYAVLSCNVSSVTLQASGSSSNGSYTITWLNQAGQSVISVTEPGQYTAVITDNNSGCTATASSIVENLDNTPLADTGPDMEISCLFPCLILQAEIGGSSGVLSIEWVGPNGFYSNELNPEVCTPGDYVLSVHEEIGGCTIYDTVTVAEVYSSINTEFTAQLCPGKCVTFAGEDFCESGNYQLIFNSWSGCDSVVHLQVDWINISAEIQLPDTLTCQKEQIYLNGQNSQLPANAAFSWSTINGNFVDLPNALSTLIDAPGIYILQINTTNDCQINDTTLVISDQSKPEIDAGEDTQLDCIDNIANIKAAVDSTLTNFDLNWIGPDNFFSTELQNQVSDVGIYTLKVKNISNGCDTEDQVYVAPPEEVSVALTTQKTCWNEPKGRINVSVLSGGQAPYSFSINALNYQADTFFQQLNSGNYTIYWKDALECGGQTDIVIPEVPPIQTNLEEVYHICSDTYTTLNAAVDLQELKSTVSYQWQDGSTTPVLRTNLAGQYWVDITGHCETLRQNVEVVNDFIPAEQNVYVPNAFSPNNDLTNDVFLPYINHELIRYQIRIFDRRGSLMFSNDDPEEGWDGKLRGRDAPAGIYAYWIEYVVLTCGGGKAYGRLQGDVTLVR